MIRASWSAGGGASGSIVAVTSVVESPWQTRHEIVVAPPMGEGGRIDVEIRIPCSTAWSLSRDRRLVRVGDRSEPPPFAGRFVVVEEGGRLSRLEFPWASRIEILGGNGTATVRAVLRDPQACGLGHWAPGKLAPGPAEYRLTVHENGLESLDDCLWVEPFPNGAPAALCVTDHPDFDSVERARLLADLLGSLGVRITKGVFPAGDPRGGKAEPGLDDSGYAAVVRDLDRAGSEIAFHGMGPRYRAPALDECRRRAEAMAPFRPATWIDHGTGAYLFSRDAVLEGGVPLARFLAEYGVVNYWSYVDTWQNPALGISSLAGRGDGDAAREFGLGVAALLRSPAALLELPYRASHLVNNVVGEIGALALRRNLGSREGWRRAARSRRDHRALAARPEVLYGLDGCSFALTREQDWAFDTILMNYPAEQLAPERIDRLRRESGLCIVHSYLCNVRRRGTGGAFERGRTGETVLTPRFSESLGHIARLQREGELAVLPLRDLRRALTDFAAARLMRGASGWELSGQIRSRPVVVAGGSRGLDSLAGRATRRFERGGVGYLEAT